MIIANDQTEEATHKHHSTSKVNYKIEIKNDSKHKKEFLVTSSTVEISKEVDVDIAERAKTFKLAGFSKGKGAPVSLVKRQIGKAVMTEHIDKLIHNVVLQIVKENNLHFTGMPNIEIKEFDPEGEIKISISFNVMPSVPEIDFQDDKFRVEILELQVNNNDIQQAKDALTKMIASYKEAAVGHVSTNGDAIIIDFHGKLNGEEFDGNKASQIRIDIGENQFIKDFEEKLTGLKKGDEKTIKVMFPKDYNEEKLAGQEVDFEIKVHDILVKDESTDVEEELKKRFNIDSTDKLEEIIREKIVYDFNSISRLRTKKLLFDKMDAELDFDLPEEMIESDFQTMWKDISEKIANGTIQKSEEDSKEEVKNIARRRVKLGLLLADVAKKNSIVVTEEDIENAKKAEKMKRPDSSNMIDEFFAKKENRDMLQGAVLEEKVVDFIISKAQKYSISVTTAEFNDKYAKEIQELIQ
jgi:trigger factor